MGADLDGAGIGAHGEDVGGIDEVGEPIAHGGHDGRAIGGGIEIGLVEDHHEGFADLGESSEGVEFGSDEVMIDDEEEEVGSFGEIAGFALAEHAGGGGFGYAWRVGEKNGASKTGPLCGVKRAGGCGAMGWARGGDLPAHERIDDRCFSRGDGAEHGDAQLARGLTGLERIES